MEKRGFQILGIEHIGLAPKAPDALSHLLGALLGLPFSGEELVPSQQTHTRFYGSGSEATGRLEILQAADGQGPIAVFLDKKGAGIHHIALQVDHIEAALSYLTQHGVELIDKQPRPGAHSSQIAFIHPRSSGGILIELVQNSISKI